MVCAAYCLLPLIHLKFKYNITYKLEWLQIICNAVFLQPNVANVDQSQFLHFPFGITVAPVYTFLREYMSALV